MCDRVIYVKSSIERKPEYQLYTLIMENDAGRFVRKKAFSQQGNAHLKRMLDHRQMMESNRNLGSAIEIAPCTAGTEGEMDFPYYEFETFQSKLSRLASQPENFCRELLKFREALVAAYGTIPFHYTEDFGQVFGDDRHLEGMEALAITDLDLNFDNVFISNDDKYIIVDYEWVMPFPIPLSFVFYRALLVNIDMSSFRAEDQELIWSAFDIDESLKRTYWEMELSFQQYVSGTTNKLELFQNKALREDMACIKVETMLNAVNSRRKGLECYCEAYDAQVRATMEMTRQRDEYHASNDELWKRVAIAEQELAKTREELEKVILKYTPFWRKHRAGKR